MLYHVSMPRDLDKLSSVYYNNKWLNLEQRRVLLIY